MDQKKAEKMIKEICDWLDSGAPGGEVESLDETVPATIARDFCWQLLFAANADGCGGCELCRS